MSASIVCDYRAVRRDGSYEIGVRPLEGLADWIEGRFRAGWRQLDVMTREGVEVGRICWTDEGRPRRTWWSS